MSRAGRLCPTYLLPLALGAASVFTVGGCARERSGERAAPESGRSSVRLSIACGAVGAEQEVCRQGVEAWAKKTGHEVRLVPSPTSATETLSLYQQLLAQGASDLDVMQVDVVWPGILSNFLADLRPYSGGVESEHFPALVANDTVGGRLVALPWFTDAGVLYARRDLLERYGESLPATWDELTRIATKIQDAERARGHKELWGFVWQGKAYEGLTCNALEWVASEDGGTFVDAQGRVDIVLPAAARALERAAGWVRRISPKGVLNYSEEEARGVFQSGHAVFMRSWPYAWALLQSADSPVRGRVDLAPLPSGGPPGRRVATLGGWQLAVSKYSAHPEVAADLVLYLTGREEQRRRALVGAFAPTRPALYEDPEVLARNPHLTVLRETLESALPRPSAPTGPKYSQVSNAIWNAVHRVLSGEQSAAESLADLDDALRAKTEGGRW